MKKILLPLFVTIGLAVYGQEEQGNYSAIAKRFMDLYNGSDYDGIFKLFDADMKKALPQERTLQFFSDNVNRNMGAIKTMELNRLHNGAHVYRTIFDKALADISISLNPNNEINGLYISPVRNIENPILERNTTQMILPFKEEWFVFWGGTTVEQNYHINYDDQKYAYDILMVKDGVSYQGDAKKNESYYVFGKEIIAPCDARVVKVITGVKDNVPGDLNPGHLTGNTIVLETVNKEYILFAHLKENSILVAKGNDVRQGEVMAQCGNSGNTTEPHLHLSLQNAVEMENSVGAKLFFNKILVNGEEKEDYLPVKEDFIQNIN
ncbi:DUF3887 domain-containing protein [Maribacter sp. 2304DJ31-5]|uniref:DUF3887 domain-containing protein n=1 Tax=Maribacter sp. 2304DJ31-5 TaxID=3386273 RepID=UPI0039BD1482